MKDDIRKVNENLKKDRAVPRGSYDQVFHRAPPARATENQLQYIRYLANDIDAICSLFSVASIEELTVAQASDAIDQLKAERR